MAKGGERNAQTFVYGTDPVSYTHLDVYKRQKLDKAAMLICSKALGHNRISVVADNYIPVSYTHLDVYKRQTTFGACKEVCRRERVCKENDSGL